MGTQALNLWYAHPDDLLVDDVAQECAALLSAEESARCKALRFERPRLEYLTARALVRTALSHYHPVPPEAWSFSRNAYGKPTAVPECGLRFNLSHSPGLVVCLVTQGSDVGVDVEPHERAKTIVELAPEVFSPLELGQFSALSGREKLDHALSLWTLKEAYIKARGLGLSLALNRFSFLFGGVEGIRLVLDPGLGDEAGRWRFCLLDLESHCVALMVERTISPNLQLWEVRPLSASPKQQPEAGEIWYPAAENTVDHIRGNKGYCFMKCRNG
jgi:4'-phosphopantetheinyl transferase